MKTLNSKDLVEEIEMKNKKQSPEITVTTGAVKPPAVPAPGRCGTFEEALKVGMKRYDNVLRELAK